ncbi:NADH-ubiquinone oxidoreductase chain 2 (mitochondrion) [Glycine max]|nr:NADH-ubiquinone oxidoreductase chain 2 [Glycine max]KAH1188281.1 NADH-ubiquinone oxidoreductase chain 2 [Glycine max]
MPWSEEYPESHVRQLNAPRGRLPLWRPLSLPYPRYTPTPSYALPAEQDALRFPLLRDNFTYFCQILLLLSTAGTISMCFDSSEQERFDAFEFIVLIPLPTRSMLFMISAHDSIAMYLAIEPQSLCFYVMAASKRKSEFSTEAGSKYLILGAFSSGILLFGYDRTTTDI